MRNGNTLPFIEPLSCLKGHVFCKECIYECLLSQKKDIRRKQSAHAAEQKKDQEEEEKLSLQKARELDAFDQRNHGAMPQYNDKNFNRDKNGFHGANKATLYEEEALQLYYLLLIMDYASR